MGAWRKFRKRLAPKKRNVTPSRYWAMRETIFMGFSLNSLDCRGGWGGRPDPRISREGDRPVAYGWPMGGGRFNQFAGCSGGLAVD
jgi:hypothetical protein